MNNNLTKTVTVGVGDVAIVILTFNEEANIAQALNSVKDWASELFVLDSFSQDRTVDIARAYGCHVVQNKFENYAKQRNFSIDYLPIKSEWVFFLDADEWLSDELKNEISSVISKFPIENGYYIKRRLVWMGRWIKRGYYPSWQLRLFRNGKGRCEDRSVNEHFKVEGLVGHLKNDFTDENRKDIFDWIVKHNNYAIGEAHELFKKKYKSNSQEIDLNILGGQAQRRRWIRYKIWNNLPLFIRPFIYFFYRYVLLGGFLDGRQAFAFHFLQALWYPMLIDVMYFEMLVKNKKTEINEN